METKIAVLATCDTKGEEALYLKQQILALGGDPIIIDIGIKGEPDGIVPDIDHRHLAELVGLDIEDMRNAPTRGSAIDMMTKALDACLQELMEEGLLSGVVCIAGASGSVLVSSPMQALPYALPKLIVSPIASGTRQFAPFVGVSDMTIMHSVVDILGLNHLSRRIFANAAGAIVGMARAYRMQSAKALPAEKCIGITMYGQTTQGVIHAKALLEKNGYTCMVFHGNGVGGPSMERLIRQNTFVGILEYNLSEMVGNTVGGFTKCSPDRLSVAGSIGLPQVAVPGSCDFMNLYPFETELEQYRGRVIYNHNKSFPLARITKEEGMILAEAIAQKLNASKGPVHVVLPLRGFSAVNVEGGPFWDKEADDAFRSMMKENLSAHIPVTEVDANINERICGETAAKALLALIES
ncbi:MAG: hypothetical protein BWY11_01149 [Firmicutes bacterium ADurb.Bin182]|nr:MAG: hypothetical protein BWY11_01149 [Firmicutes bacterium ADurb.Bin182]